MFIISPSSFKELYATTSSFQIIVYTIINRLSELYIFSSKKFSVTQLQNWKNWKIKLQKFRKNTVLVFSLCSKPITHGLVVCVSHILVNQSKETNERVDVYTKPYDTIFQVLTWHESMNERPHRARRRAESHYRTPSNTEAGSFIPFQIFSFPLLHPTHFFFLKFSFQIPFSSSWVQNMVVKATCTMQSQSVWTTSNTDQTILTVRYLSWIQHFSSWKITQHMPVGCLKWR